VARLRASPLPSGARACGRRRRGLCRVRQANLLAAASRECDMVDMSTTPSEPARMGRPSGFSEDLAARICEHLAQGRSLVEIGDMADMPCLRTLHNWLTRYPVFHGMYLRAKAAGTEAMVEAMRHRVMSATPEQAQLIRAQADWCKFEVGRLNPRRWAERVQAEVSGPAGGPIQIAPAPPPMVPREIAAAVKSLLSRAEHSAGLVTDDSKSDASRLDAIMKSGRPHPDLIEALAYADPSDAESA
jgi:hypothetical protein